MSTTIRNVSRIFANNRADSRVDFSRKEVRGVVMGIFWTLMVTVSLVYGAVSGRLSAVTAAALEGAAAAVELVLVMAGALCLWSGVLELMRRRGMAAGSGAVTPEKITQAKIKTQRILIRMPEPVGSPAVLSAQGK